MNPPRISSVNVRAKRGRSLLGDRLRQTPWNTISEINAFLGVLRICRPQLSINSSAKTYSAWQNKPNTEQWKNELLR